MGKLPSKADVQSLRPSVTKKTKGHMKKLLAVPYALASLLLSGCAGFGPGIQTSYTAFHSISQNVDELTVAVMPWRSDLNDSLEFKTYVTLIESKLVATKIKLAVPNTQPTHVLFFDYGIDDGRIVTSNYLVPQFGITGTSSAQTTGTATSVGNVTYFNATTAATPTYGVTGYQTGSRSTEVFTRFANLDLVQLATSREPQKKVYEGRLKSQGSCGNLAALMPSFIQAIFSNFPGKSGQTERRDIPWNGQC
jgi:hypothetical protein